MGFLGGNGAVDAQRWHHKSLAMNGFDSTKSRPGIVPPVDMAVTEAKTLWPYVATFGVVNNTDLSPIGMSLCDVSS